METRIVSRFVVDGGHIEEVDSRGRLEDIINSALGVPKTGRLLKITVTAETLSDKPWAVCDLTGSYGVEAKCGDLIAPGTMCTGVHYHVPAWTGMDLETGPVCTECVRLNIEPSRAYEEPTRYTYNHRNDTNKSGD